MKLKKKVIIHYKEWKAKKNYLKLWQISIAITKHCGMHSVQSHFVIDLTFTYANLHKHPLLTLL